jgi:hypothetical protein
MEVRPNQRENIMGKNKQINKIFDEFSRDEIETIVLKLRRAGVSQGETLSMLYSKLNIDYGEARKLVYNAIAWRDQLERNLELLEEFFGSLEQEAEEGLPHEKCSCCGNLTVLKPASENPEICPVCAWQDDIVQSKNPDFVGKPNGVSLNQARVNYKKFKAKSRNSLKNVRDPRGDELPAEFDNHSDF